MYNYAVRTIQPKQNAVVNALRNGKVTSNAT